MVPFSLVDPIQGVPRTYKDMSQQWHMQSVRVLKSDLICSMENIFTQTMLYCVEISELALNKLAQKAEAE